MIEVAIAAVNAVFDWKAYLRENFPGAKGLYEAVEEDRQKDSETKGPGKAGAS